MYALRQLLIQQALKKSSGNISYPGLIAAWSAKGKTNDDEDRATLKDLTGNGHDITLNGFAFSEMSGYGGYKTNMLNWKYNNNSAVILSSANKFITYSTREIATHFWDYVLNPPIGTIHRPSFKLKISGLNEDEVIYYRYQDGEDFSVLHDRNPLYNGINIFPEINAEIVTEKLPYITVFEINSQIILNKEITFEILPEYPDALVFDGVDDYGINKNMPILTDYTFIAKRKDYAGACLFTKGEDIYNSAFIFEGKTFNNNTYNFGKAQDVNLLKDLDISWQTKLFYNEQPLLSGGTSDKKGAFIGKISKKDNRFWKGAFYSAYLFDRSLDEQEIKAFIRKYIDPEYLLPSEIPTPDCYYDFSQGSNDDADRDTIKDYSGNGNDAVAHNFAWNEEGSGYKDGVLYFDGVDDYISLDAFDSGFKTVFIVCKPLIINKVIYGHRVTTSGIDFCIFNQKDNIAYTKMINLDKSKVYINNKTNSTLKTQDLINKKHLININYSGNVPILSSLSKIKHPIIGEDSATLNSGQNYYMNMALYKFLGFKEALTEEQMQAVIKKYNLLDEVDEIEVS